MAEIISVNYYKKLMSKIQEVLKTKSFQQIVWFGECSGISLIYDYLAADGYLISAVLDNNPLKRGKVISRNWCMPFTFQYIDIPKMSVDFVVANKPLPELTIISPDDLHYYISDISQAIFFTMSVRANEIRYQLLGMGACDEKIIILPTEQERWNAASKNLHEQTEKKAVLGREEHKGILLNILREFIGYCAKNKLRYFLAYGTLIGAVRHKGMIPWDDDIDIMMPVEDYKKLLQGFPKGGRYEILDISANDDYFFPFAKVVDNRTYLHHEGCPITWMQGAYIDIFPMSGYLEGEAFENQWRRQSLLDIEWYWYYAARDILLERIEDPRERVIKEKFRIGFDNAKKVGVLTTLPAKPWALDKSIFSHSCKVEFEKELYNAPAGYDEYLRSVYSDYMKMPPEEKRRTHGFPSYRRIL